MFFIFAGVAFAGNIGNYVYGVYAEVFPGVTWVSGSSDYVYASNEWFNGTFVEQTNDPADGQKHYHMETTAAGSFYIGFQPLYAGGAGPQNMSEYMNGEIEFWVRSETAYAMNLINLGYKEQNTNIERVKSLAQLRTLASTTPFVSDGNWYKVVLPLKGATWGIADVAIESGLSSVALPLLIKVNGAVTFDIDYVVWRKSSTLQENIGANTYGVYTESYPGASAAATNNDKIVLRNPSNITFKADNTALEGVEYIRTNAANASWSYEFADSNNNAAFRNLSAYYGGSLEFNIRVPAASTNYNNIKFGFVANQGDGWFFSALETLSSLGVSNDGQWHKVSVPIVNGNFNGAFSATQLQNVRALFQMENKTNASVDIDNIVWKKYEDLPPQIGNDNYGVFSETVPGASEYASTADRVRTVGGITKQSSGTSYEGNTYIKTPASGTWGIEFVDPANPATVRPADMSAYFGGALEFYVRVPSSAGNSYGNVTVAVNKTGWSYASLKTLAELGVKNNGQWQKVSIPLNASGFLNLNIASHLATTTRLIEVRQNGGVSIDIDHIVWRKAASEDLGNKKNDVYGIYTDWIPGVDFSTVTAYTVDRVALFPWTEQSAPEGMTDGKAYEGINYLQSHSGGGWGVFFVDINGVSMVRSMSEFYNGVLEFYVKGTPSANIGSVSVGLKCGGSDKVRTLSSLGITAATGGWQKVSIPLNSTGFAGLSQAVLLETTEVLFMMNNNGAAVDIDYIVWKKDNPLVPSANVNLTLKNRTDNSEADQIIQWDNNVILSSGATEVASSQYIEVQLSGWFESDADWGLQIYTDNSMAEIQYTGEMTTSTVSGLVSANSPGEYLPMRWRASDLLFPLPEPPEPNNKILTWNDAWSAFRDKTAESFYYNRVEDIRFCDRRGFKYAHTNEFGQLGYGALNDEKTFYIYFSAAFSNALRGHIYKNDAIIIELFYE